MSERTPVYLALLVLSAVVGLVLLREPLFGPYQAMKGRLAELNEEADRLEREIRERRGGRQQLSALLDAYGEPLAADQRGMAAAAFYGRIEGLASGCGLKVESVSPKPETLTDEGLLRFGATVNLAGDTRAVVAFLAQIQASTRVIGIDRVTVRRRGEAERPLTMQVQLASYGIADRETRAELAKAQARKAAERRRAAPGAEAEQGEKTP